MFIGFLAIIWCVVWLTCITESPVEDKHITKEELKYIVDSIGPTDDTKSKCVVSIFYFMYVYHKYDFFYSQLYRLPVERYINIDASLGNNVCPFL